MKTKLLPSLSERVDSINDDIINGKYNTDRHPFDTVFHYNRFLKKKPELYMFVACDKDGNVLEKPRYYIVDGVYELNPLTPMHNRITDEDMRLADEYQQALDRVIFDGFEVVEKSENRILLKSESLTVFYELSSKLFYLPFICNYKTLADLSGKVYVNINGIKDSGI